MSGGEAFALPSLLIKLKIPVFENFAGFLVYFRQSKIHKMTFACKGQCVESSQIFKV